MGVALPVELVIGIAHRVGTGAPEHDLKIDRLQALVLITVDDPRRAGDTFPRPERPADPAAAVVLDKDRQISFEHEEDLLDLVRVRRVALPRWHIHDAESKGARRDHRRILMLAGAAGADEAMLRTAIPVDPGILEGFPIALLVAKATNKALGDLVERQRSDFGRHLVPGFGHRITPSVVYATGVQFRSAARPVAARAAARAAVH